MLSRRIFLFCCLISLPFISACATSPAVLRAYHYSRQSILVSSISSRSGMESAGAPEGGGAKEKNKKYRKDKPWDVDTVDKWRVPLTR